MTQGEQSEPIVELDHDHEDLDVLLHDLAALVHQCSVDATRERALKEARHLLRYFQRDMEAHFQREEEDLFPVLLEELPETRERVQALLNAHGTFTKLVAEIGSALASDTVANAALRDCQSTISTLMENFTGHSETEKELVRALDSAVEDPARRAALRERLEGF